MRALHIPPNTPTPTPTKSLHAFVPVSSFGSSPPLRTSFSLCGGPATEQAATAQLQSRLLRAIGSMLQGQTTMVATLQAEGIAITAAFLLLFLVCVVALLQSRLIKAAGHWQQYRVSVIQPRNHTLLSRTNTTAAELYYLRHMRSCAAAAMGNKGGNPSPSTALQISGASFIGRLLQSIWRRCYLIVFLPFDRLLQSIGQMVRYYAKTAMKLITVSFAMLQGILTWLTPLESAACFH